MPKPIPVENLPAVEDVVVDVERALAALIDDGGEAGAELAGFWKEDFAEEEQEARELTEHSAEEATQL